MSLLDSDDILKASYTRHSAHRYFSSYHTDCMFVLPMLLRNCQACSCDPCCPGPASRIWSPHSTPSERFASSAFARWHVCHLCHNSTASRRRGPPPFRCEANRENRLRFAWNPPAIRPMASPQAGGDQTTCSPSTGHGLRHSTWEGCRTIHLYQELRLGG